MSQAPQSTSLVSGELPPLPPERRDDLQKYQLEVDRFCRQLLDYIRRLSSKTAATQQIIEEQGLVDWRFDASSGKFQVKFGGDTDWSDASGDQPTTVTQVIANVAYDTGSHVLSEDQIADLVVLSVGSTTSDVTVDTATNCK